MFAVPRHGPERTSDAGQVRRAAGVALAVRRHHDGRRPGGGPRRGVPRERHRGRVRRSDDQLAGRVPRVHLRRHAVRQELRAAVRPVRPGFRPQDNGQDGGTERACGTRQRHTAHGRRGRVP